MKISEVLKLAKQHLQTGAEEQQKATYICSAIKLACRHGEIKECHTNYADSAQNFIKRKLGGYQFRSYAIAQGLIPLFDEYSFDEIQEARHKWLDLLIKELEAKGE